MQLVRARPPGLEGFPFYVHDAGDAYISEKIRRRGVWEAFETHMMLNLLQHEDQALDIGANIGWYTVAAARRVGASGRVFAFEPDAVNFEILKANIERNLLTCVCAVPYALGRRSGKAKLRPSSDNQGDVRVRAFSEHVSRLDDDEIQVVALDSYLETEREFDLGRLRIVKLDVQGFEYEVLCGAARVLRELPARAILFIEFDPSLLQETAEEACTGLIETLASLNRQIFAIERPLWRLRGMTIADLSKAARPGASKSFDLIVVHNDFVADLGRAMPVLPRLLSGRLSRR